MNATNLSLTDWIPCATQPVRVGFYEREWNYLALSKNENLDYWDGSSWRLGDGAGGYSIVSHSILRWRGVRRWVLVREQDLPLAEFSLCVASVAKNGGVDVGSLPYAMGFNSEEAALAFAAEHSITGKQAVLP